MALTRVPVRRSLSALKVYSFHKNVRRLLAREDYDIVFGLTQFFPLDIYRAGGGVHRYWMRLRYKNGFIRKIKYITSPVHLVMAWLEAKIMEPGNHRFIVANSKLVKEHLLTYFEINEDNIRVIYNGIDHELFNPQVKRFRNEVRKDFGIGEDRTVALFVSNNWSRKGLETILKAMSLEEGICLLVVGRGKKERLQKLIDKLGLKRESVIFAGPTQQVERFYGAADFFLLPTQYDPCSGVCQEAMACGLPVVTTRANGASEFIAQGENGFILDDWSDHRSLAEFYAPLKDKTKREELGRRACETMKDFTWERTVKGILEVCEMVLGRGKNKYRSCLL
jgi:UDP-glucose:(heptosyl)LPS alpha-1,3-glucosyltransferase